MTVVADNTEVKDWQNWSVPSLSQCSSADRHVDLPPLSSANKSPKANPAIASNLILAVSASPWYTFDCQDYKSLLIEFALTLMPVTNYGCSSTCLYYWKATKTPTCVCSQKPSINPSQKIFVKSKYEVISHQNLSDDLYTTILLLIARYYWYYYYYSISLNIKPLTLLLCYRGVKTARRGWAASKRPYNLIQVYSVVNVKYAQCFVSCKDRYVDVACRARPFNSCFEWSSEAAAAFIHQKGL